MKRSVVRSVLLMLQACLAMAVAGCPQGPVHSPGKIQVVTTLFPLYDFVRAVGGERVSVTMLLPPGVEPHSFEPKPDDLLRVSRADLFIYTNRFMEPWAAELLKGMGSSRPAVVDASVGVNLLPTGGARVTAHEHDGHDSPHREGGMDPHIWLDFDNARNMVGTIAAALSQRDPVGRNVYLANAVAYQARLAELDRSFRVGLAGCRTRVLLHGGHDAFGYLAARYGLEYRAVSATSASAEPTPGEMMRMVRLMREQRLRYLYTEELLSPRVAEAIARETGGGLLKLHAAHNVSREELAGGATFIGLMERNLENLRRGLECQ